MTGSSLAVADAPPQQQQEAAVVSRLRRLMCLFSCLLVASTWPLWTSGSEFPQIPWSEMFGRAAPHWLDWIALCLLAIWIPLEWQGLRRNRRGTWIIRALVMIPLLGVLLVDQHRMQPWVCQMLMMATILTTASERTAIRCLQWLTISIYVHSALSKLDTSFVEIHGPWLLDGLAKSIGLSTELWSETTRRSLAILFPVGELLTAMALVVQRTHRLGLISAIAMHALLLLTLGPWGHAHKPAVLIWNVFFILLDLLLFGRWQRITAITAARETLDQDPGRSTWPTRSNDRLALILTALFALLPCLSWWGLWDHWPSWAVYSSRPAIVEVFVPEEDIERLSESLQPFVGSPEPFSDHCRVNLDAWSFETQWCPMYPQERYRVAIALAICERSEIDTMRIIIHSSPDRWTGERQESVLKGIVAIQQNAKAYLLNTSARPQ